MIYSIQQKKLLEYIACTNNECAPSTIIRKIMEITDLCVIEFIDKKSQVVFYTSTTGNNMIPQRFIQCLVLLDMLERNNQIFIEKGNSVSKNLNYIVESESIALKSKIRRKIKTEVEKQMFSSCDKFYDLELPRPISICGKRNTNAYELILKYTNVIIYPTPELVEYVEKGFSTPEDVKHREVMKWTIRTLLVALFIPLITLLINLIVGKCSSSSITIENDKIKVEHIDTIQPQTIPTQFLNEKND